MGKKIKKYLKYPIFVFNYPRFWSKFVPKKSLHEYIQTLGTRQKKGLARQVSFGYPIN